MCVCNMNHNITTLKLLRVGGGGHVDGQRKHRMQDRNLLCRAKYQWPHIANPQLLNQINTLENVHLRKKRRCERL